MTLPAEAAPAVALPPARLACGATGCPSTGVVQWRRRLTDAEFAEVVADEESRREQVLLLADPELPAPTFGPLPVLSDCVRAVYACGPHAITLAAGALVHQATCSAPDPTHTPACSCTPEAPSETGAPTDPTITLPTGWIVPALTP